MRHHQTNDNIRLKLNPLFPPLTASLIFFVMMLFQVNIEIIKQLIIVEVNQVLILTALGTQWVYNYYVEKYKVSCSTFNGKTTLFRPDAH